MSERTIDRSIDRSVVHIRNVSSIYTSYTLYNTHPNWLVRTENVPLHSKIDQIALRIHTTHMCGAHINSVFPKWSYRILFYSTHTHAHTLYIYDCISKIVHLLYVVSPIKVEIKMIETEVKRRGKNDRFFFSYLFRNSNHNNIVSNSYAMCN